MKNMAKEASVMLLVANLENISLCDLHMYLCWEGKWKTDCASVPLLFWDTFEWTEEFIQLWEEEFPSCAEQP